MNRTLCVVPRLRALHFHIDGFFGRAGKLDATVCVFFCFFLVCSPSDGKRQKLGRITPSNPIEAPQSKAFQDSFIKGLKISELCTGMRDDTGEETPTPSHTWLRALRRVKEAAARARALH